MSRKSTTRLGILLAALFMFSSIVSAQQADRELRSVLVPEQDLRPIVDPDRPDAPEPKAARQDERAESNRKETEDEALRVSLIPGLNPIADTPRPNPQKVGKGPQVRPVSRNPLRDLGVTIDSRQTARVRVGGVLPQSPAQRAGIRRGDAIVSINGKATAAAEDLSRRLAAEMHTSRQLAVELVRGRRRQTVQVELPTVRTDAVTSAPSSSAGRITARRVSTAQAATPSNAAAAVAQSQAQAARPSVQQTATPRPQARSRSRYTRPVNRPLVGDGGRLFGNGRLINSTRRLLGLDSR